MSNLYAPISDTISEISKMMERQSARNSQHQLRMANFGLQKAQLENQLMDAGVQREASMLKLQELRAKFAPTEINSRSVFSGAISNSFGPVMKQKLHDESAAIVSDGKAAWGEDGRLYDKTTNKPFTVPYYKYATQLQKVHGYILSHLNPDTAIANQIEQATLELNSAKQPLDKWAKNIPAANLVRNNTIRDAKKKIASLEAARTNPAVRIQMNLTQSQLTDSYANSLIGQVPQGVIDGLRASSRTALSRADRIYNMEAAKASALAKLSAADRLNQHKVDAANVKAVRDVEIEMLKQDRQDKRAGITAKGTTKNKVKIDLYKGGVYSHSVFFDKNAGDKFVPPKGYTIKETGNLTEAQALDEIEGAYSDMNIAQQWIKRPGETNQWSIATSLFGKFRAAGQDSRTAKDNAIATTKEITAEVKQSIEKFNKDQIKRKGTKKEKAAARRAFMKQIEDTIERLTTVEGKQKGIRVIP